MHNAVLHLDKQHFYLYGFFLFFSILFNILSGMMSYIHSRKIYSPGLIAYLFVLPWYLLIRGFTELYKVKYLWSLSITALGSIAGQSCGLGSLTFIDSSDRADIDASLWCLMHLNSPSSPHVWPLPCEHYGYLHE